MRIHQQLLLKQFDLEECQNPHDHLDSLNEDYYALKVIYKYINNNHIKCLTFDVKESPVIIFLSIYSLTLYDSINVLLF